MICDPGVQHIWVLCTRPTAPMFSAFICDVGACLLVSLVSLGAYGSDV